MAEPNNTLRIDGKFYVEVTSGRAQALIEALDIALSSDKLDKRVKGVVSAQRKVFADVASGKIIERNPACWVYIVQDIGPNGEKLTKIGHARNVERRFARRTDRPTGLQILAAWRFASVAEAMMRENAARKKYAAYDGGGGEEWLIVNADKVLTDSTSASGDPLWLGGD